MKKIKIIFTMLLLIFMTMPCVYARNTVSPYVTLLTSNIFSNPNRTQVRYLQKELNAVIGSELDTDGIKGKKTNASILEFQKKYGLEQDGKVGPKTRKALNDAYLARKAIVSVYRLNIRDGASTTNTNVIGKLTRGNILTILNSSIKDWYLIEYNDIVGYVYAPYTKTSFIEVDIVSQTLRLYKNSYLFLDTMITTGKKGSYDTTKGYYDIMFIDTDRVLRPSGAHVDYWMRFNDAEALGIHDASWRGDYENFKYFGGTVYKNQNAEAGSRYSGSHGCVNVPLPKMEIIFENAGMGTPVYVH